MRKNLFILTGLIICTAFMTFGCRKEEVTPITVPDVLIEEIPSELPEEPTAEAPVTEEPIVKAPDEEYVHWSKLHDYHLDQQDLAADGEFKNLTLQLGSNPDELHITWFSKSGSTGKVKFEAEGMFHDLSAKAETRPSHAVPGYHRNSALIKGLEANTTYTYHLQNGSHKSSNYTYTTSDLYSTDFTFTIAGDAEIGLGDIEEYDSQRSIWRVVLNRMRNEIPESSFLLSMGDQVGKSDSVENYDYFLDNSVLYSTALVPVMGNHDVGSGFFPEHFRFPNLTDYCQSQGADGDYWFVRGNALFMVINTHTTMDYEDHEYFVAETVAKNPDAKWRIIISHVSPATVVDRYQDQREFWKDTFADMAEDYDIDLFLGGHDHVYTRSYFLGDDCEPIPEQEFQLQHEFHNPEHPIFVVFGSSTNALFRSPDGPYPWAAISVQNDVPQLGKVQVTENSFTITTYDADHWTEVDHFTIYKD